MKTQHLPYVHVRAVHTSTHMCVYTHTRTHAHAHLSFIELLQVYTYTTQPLRHRGSPAPHTVEIPCTVNHLLSSSHIHLMLTFTKSTSSLSSGNLKGFHLIYIKHTSTVSNSVCCHGNLLDWDWVDIYQNHL